MNDWLFEHNAPFVREGRWMDLGLPGYNVMAEEDYYTNQQSSLGSYGSLMLLLVTVLGTFFYMRQRRKQNK